MLRRFLTLLDAYVVTPILRRSMKSLAPHARIDPWRRGRWRAPIVYYAAPSREAFAHYLAGPSTVHVGSIEAIEAWLKQCVADLESAPGTQVDWRTAAREFEERRRGNCMAHALWGWRKLVELGYSADVVIGWLGRPHADGSSRHAWVLLQDAAGVPFVFETVAKGDDPMVRALATVREMYTPEYGVDPTGARFSFDGGILASLAALEVETRDRTT